ncbi:hypothetical protein Arub01_20370 [Actinomadura rubrobrunea]|uniref:ATP-binding protein n=1 Tax=Actinomadura rubrobrunea TaxID=115335 RepID=A0A9W6PVJ1_9ACTN|nr:ATP-binding protein [Actinomadura rubrobrunea]GLW63793.1 hypothetical protein Arub01_20370 [Actinomadura rubrobrunea]
MQSTPVPESLDLPPYLDEALRVLVSPTGRALSFTVLPEPESVTEARHFALCHLDEWGMASLCDDVGLVVSELVTNALRHSGGAASHGSAQPGPTAYRGTPTFPGTAGYRDVTGCRDAMAYRPSPYTDSSPYTEGYGAAAPESACHGAAYRPHGAAYRPSLDPLGSAPMDIRLRLLYQGSWLLCGIMDASPAAPRRKEPDFIAETGRGLHIVESFSDRWGWRALPGGKVVWALFRRP